MTEVFANAFKAKLANVPPDLTEDQARQLVADAERDGLEAAREWAVGRLVREAAAAREAREYEASKARIEADRREREEKQARKAWRKLFGHLIADRLKPWTNYQLLEAEGLRLAVPVDRVGAVSAAIRDATGTPVEDTGKVAIGVRLGTIADSGLDYVDPDPKEAVDLVWAVVERRREAERVRREEASQRAAVERNRLNEVRMYGTTVEE